MEVKYIRYIVALLLVLFQWVNVLGGADDWREELILEGVKKLDALIAQNKANEEAGRSHLNSYIVNLDGGWSQKGDFIEERGEGPNDKFTLLESDQLSLLDNDLKSFHALYSPKKEVGVYVIMVNNFQLLIRNQLPGNPEVQKLSDFAYYIDKDRQDQIKDLTKQMKGIVREVIDRTKNKGYTKQTYGILYGVISTYDLNSPDLTTGIIQDQLEPVSYLSVFMDKSAATPMESYRVINSEMPKGKDLVRSYAAVYPRLEALIKGFEKGYLKSRAIASLEEEAVALGIKEGPGRTLFMNLPKEKTLSNEQKVSFAELCKYLNTETSGKSFAFYHPGLPNEIGQNGKDLYEQTWKYIYEKDLLTKEKFSAHFFQNQCRDVDLIFANVDLWEGIDRDTYNKNSLDFIRPGKLYEYSFADLKVRERHKSTKLYSVIQSLELTGDAEPLSIKDNHDQYVACFGTNSAVFSWSSYFSNTVSDVVEVGVAYQAARAATAFINANKAAKKGELKKLLDFFRKYFNTQKLDDLINAIGNPNLKNFVVGLRTGDNFLIKQGEGAVNKLSIRTFHNNDFTELATIENNVLTIRKDGILDNGAEMVSIQKLADDIEIKGTNGEDLSGRIEVVTDDSGRGWFRIKNVTQIEASLERIRISNPDIDITSFKADFGNDLDILTKFEKGELSVDSWNILKNTGLKTDVKWLEKISDLKKAGFELIEEGAGVKILRQGDEIAKIADDVLQVKIPHGNGWAKQVNTPDALKILDDVTKSKKVYKIGTLDVSETTGAQYWSPENPLSFQKIEDYAEKYGLPVERLKGDNKFIIVGEIGQGELLITRPAVPYGGSKGGGIEIVTPSGAVKMESFHILKVD